MDSDIQTDIDDIKDVLMYFELCIRQNRTEELKQVINRLIRQLELFKFNLDCVDK
jgi:hypothetical protein